MSIYFAQIAGKMNGNNTARETDNQTIISLYKLYKSKLIILWKSIKE